MSVTINVVEALSVIAFFGVFFFAISYTGLRADVRSLERRIEDVETVQRGGHVGSGQRE